MPAIIPSYMYMIAAMAAVGTLLIFSFNSYATTLRSVPEIEQLDNLLSRIAAKALELITLTEDNADVRTVLDLPTTLGSREYWIRLNNDTMQSWVEGGLGEIGNHSSEHKVFLPGHVSVAGYHLSGYGFAVLRCYASDSVLQLTLSSGR